MADIRYVVNDPKTGKSYSKSLEDTTAVTGRKLGETLPGSFLGLTGYELKITGGSDNAGFPMRQDLDMTVRKKLLLKKGDVGLRKADRGILFRKTVSGNTVSAITAQLNMRVTKHGSKSIEELWNIQKEEKKEEQPAAAAPAPEKK